MRSIWDKGFWDRMSSKTSLIARLLPLNKCHPKTPEISKYRPIIIMSPILKFCELICKEKLKNYCKNHIEKEQTGFIEGYNTGVNLTRLMNNIWQIKKMKKKRKSWFMLFVDFKSAYDLVDREKLYSIIESKNILNKGELQLIKFIHQKSIISLGRAQCTTRSGVPQGSGISPLLFNIFLNDLLVKIKNEFGSTIITYGYADDPLFTSNHINEIKKCIQVIENWSSSNNMKLNKDKSGIMVLFDKKKEYYEADSILDIPIVKKYKYLG